MLAYNTSSAIKDAIPCHQPSTNNSTGGEPSIDVGAGRCGAMDGGGRNGHGIIVQAHVEDGSKIGGGRMKGQKEQKGKA